MWIGASRNEANGFSWSDGKVLSFTKWGKGEPAGDTDPNNKGCAKMDQDSYWGESDCTMTNGYVCEIPRPLSNCVDIVESSKVPCQGGQGIVTEIDCSNAKCCWDPSTTTKCFQPNVCGF